VETFRHRNNQEAKTHKWPGRIPPVTDTKMIVAWNSLMISGLCGLMGYLTEPYLELALAEFHLDNQWSRKGDLIFPSTRVVEGRFNDSIMGQPLLAQV